MRNSLLLFFLLLGFALSAQDVDLRIDTTLSAEALVKNLLGGNRGIEVKEADFKGARQAAGSFKIIGAECCFFKEGIILSTGEAEHARGPNMKSSSGEALGTRGRNHLARMARNVSMDAAMLQFDFKPSGDSLAFEFVFASEEYPEFVNRGVNDVFVFLLIDMETNEIKNLATVPGTKEPISIDNINHRWNHRLYNNNSYWSGQKMDFWKENLEKALMANVLQFDGYTVPLIASAKVIPGRWYKMSLEISDIGDGLYDSAVFLKAGSFTDRAGEDSEQKVDLEIEDTDWLHSRKEGDTTVLELQLYFDHDEYKLVDSEMEKLSSVADELKAKSFSILVKGHTDNKGEETYNQTLSERRAKEVRLMLLNRGFDAEKIKAIGRGEYEPLEKGELEEQQAKNRRVELWLY